MEIMKILPDGMPSGLSVNSFQIEGIPGAGGLEIWNGKKGSDIYSSDGLKQKIEQRFSESSGQEPDVLSWFIQKAETDTETDDRIKAVLNETADGLSALIGALSIQSGTCKQKNSLSDGDWRFWRNCRCIYFTGGLFQKQAGRFLTGQISRRLLQLGIKGLTAGCFSSQVTPSLMGCAEVFPDVPKVYVFDFGSTRMKRAAAVRQGGQQQIHEFDAVLKNSVQPEDGMECARALHRQIVSVILETIREAEQFSEPSKEYYISACISNNVLDEKIAWRGNYCALRLLDENYGAYLEKELAGILDGKVSVHFMNDAYAAALLFREEAPFTAVITCGTAMGIAYPKPVYREADLVRTACRENNKKRNYLVVNRLQGKHIAAEPRLALTMFSNLAQLLQKAYEKEKLLIVGFAETATAIGAAAAVRLGAYYIQTTRETIPGVQYLYFSEEHSHASQQKVVKEDLDRIMGHVDRVIFAEDEVTTGKTILNMIGILEQQYPGRVSYAVASLLNGMDDAALKNYESRGIPLHYLVKTDHSIYENRAQQYAEACLPAGTAPGTECFSGYLSCGTDCRPYPEYRIEGRMDARRLVQGREYEKACAHLWEKIRAQLQEFLTGRVLVLGTEEFMYPALYTAAKIAEGGADVRFHASTRSPIAVSGSRQYPLHVRYELLSVYDSGRKTYLYDIDAYDTVFIVTDAESGAGAGMDSLVHAVRMKNENVKVIRWCSFEKFL